MRVFTKITKVPFSKLRQEGHISVVYVDDSYLQGDTYQACMVNILDTVNLLRGLGFTIHAEKSVLIYTPSKDNISRICFEFSRYDDNSNHGEKTKNFESMQIFT